MSGELELRSEAIRRVQEAQAELAAADLDVDAAYGEAGRDLPVEPGPRVSEIERRRKQMAAARERHQEATKAVRSRLDEMMRAMEAKVAPLRAEIDKLNTELTRLNTFLGGDELWELLVDGDQADADEPIVVYQRVEFMDERLAVENARVRLSWKVDDDGQTTEEIGSLYAKFDDWLTYDPDALGRLIPATRGVVCCRPSRQKNRSNRAAADGHMTDPDKVARFYFRNGDQLSVVDPGMSIGENIVPDQEPDEQFGLIALMLQGIVERTTALSPLPKGEVNFANPEHYDDGRIRVVESSTQLPSKFGSASEWLNRVKRDTSPGHRIVVGHIPQSYDHTNIKPRTANAPEPGVHLTKRGDGGLKISWHRGDNGENTWGRYDHWGRWVPPGPMQSWASVTCDTRDEWWLPIDHEDITLEAIEHFLVDHDTYRHYGSYIPKLHTAREILITEARREAPFRALLAEQLDADPELAAAVIAAAVRGWKTKNVEHRPLMADDNDAEAFEWVKSACEKALAFRAVAVRHDVREATEAIEGLGWFGRTTDGTYMAYELADQDGYYWHRHEWTPKQGKARGVTTEWVPCPKIQPTWQTITTEDVWLNRPERPNLLPLTTPEFETLMDRLRMTYPDAVTITHTTSQWSRDRFEIFMPPVGPVRDRRRPLTGEHTDWDFDVFLRFWDRYEGVAVLDDWESTTSGRPPNGFACYSAMAREQSRWREYQDAYYARADRLAEAFKDHVEQVCSEREYRAFLEQYGAEAEGRWEGHRALIFDKRIKGPKIAGRGHWRTPVEKAVDGLVEQRADLRHAAACKDLVIGKQITEEQWFGALRSISFDIDEMYRIDV